MSSILAVDLERAVIAPYFENKKAALSLTFDDGFAAEVEDAVAILDPLGIKGTFFLIPIFMDGSPESARFVSWDRAIEIQKNGHELGTHGTIKEKLHEATDERLDELVNGAWLLIRDKTGIAPVAYAAPGGSIVDDRVAAVIWQNHTSIRDAKRLPNAVTAGYGSAGTRVWQDEKARAQIEQAIEDGSWFIPIVHAIVGGYSPFQSKDEFRIHCEWIKSREDDLWIAPMGVVGSYVFARNRSQMTVRSSAADQIVFALENPDPSNFRHPLTVVIPAASAISASASDPDGNALPVMLRDGAILISVTKPNSEVTVRWE